MAKVGGSEGGTGASVGEATDGGSDDDDDEPDSNFLPISMFCHLLNLFLVDAGLIGPLQHGKIPIFCAYTPCDKSKSKRLKATKICVLDDGGRLIGYHTTLSFMYPRMSIFKDIGECLDTQEDLLVLTRKMPPNCLIEVVILVTNMKLIADVVCPNLAGMVELSNVHGLIAIAIYIIY